MFRSRLVDQLKVGGRMVIPVGELYQELEVITKTPSGVEREQNYSSALRPDDRRSEEDN